MAIHEFKTEIAIAAIDSLEETLALLEEPRWMIVEDKPSAHAWVTGYFESDEAARTAWTALVAAAKPACFVGQPEVHVLADADWRESYKAHFKAWKFGRLHWVPVWENAIFRLPPGEEVLWLDPGLAFGTGNHETTRLVVERLVAFALRHGTDGRVIDAGCGSGILALSASKLGFGDVVAFDNDPEAVRVSGENAALNAMSGRVSFFVGDLVSGLDGRRAELVMANIQADVLVRFADRLLGATTPGGMLVLSGILTRELDSVREAFATKAPGWKTDSQTRGEWADLVLIRPSS